MMCKVLTGGFALLYAIALGLWAIGNWGLFGSERGPLAGVFLVPLGWPWNRLLDSAGDSWRLMLGILSPAVNLLLLLVLCRWRRERRGG